MGPGETQSVKTTRLNGLAAGIRSREWVVTAEEIFELKLPLHRLVVGEVRGPNAWACSSRSTAAWLVFRRCAPALGVLVLVCPRAPRPGQIPSAADALVKLANMTRLITASGHPLSALQSLPLP
jgi:hypothetical protein